VDFAARVERLIGPLPGEKEARAISVLALIAGAILAFLSIYYGAHGETFMGRALGGDFVQFYAVGKILNSGPAEMIYDIPTIVRTEHESLPAMSQTQMLLFGNAPYIAELFRPLALLPYTWAYCVWLAISFALYAGALRILFKTAVPFLLALSSPMFLLETWIGGQISVIAFLGFALFLDNFRRGRWFVAGLSLAIAAYKPSLIAIPGVMLVIGACWRAVAGVAAGSAIAALLSIATAGIHGCLQWLSALRVFGLLATGAEASIRRVKYVDFNSFFSILLGPNAVARACAFVAIGGLLAWLALAWWKSRDQNKQVLVAATIAIMLAANLYVPVYDTILLAAAAAIAAQAFGGTKIFRLWVLALYLVPFLTQSFAEFARLQILTPLLAAFGLWMLSSAIPQTTQQAETNAAPLMARPSRT
jgi:hypothetical protein